MEVTPELDHWLKENIAPMKTWSVQTLCGEIPRHKDWEHSDHKLNFLVDPGNTEADTVWYSDEGLVLHRERFIPGTWNSLVVNVNHTVTNLSMEQTRISVIQGNERLYEQFQK
jgi:hypothetical protein